MFKSIFTILTIISLALAANINQLERRDLSESAFLSSFFNANPNSGSPQSDATTTVATAATTTAKSTSIKSSSSLDVLAFYQNFMSNRYSYVQEHMQWFKTHSFSDIGSSRDSLASFLTHTDQSFTTYLAANPQITSMLSAAATQMPWYTSWSKMQAYVTVVSGSTVTVTPTSTGQKNAASSYRVSMGQGKMAFLTSQIIAVMVVGVIMFFVWCLDIVYINGSINTFLTSFIILYSLLSVSNCHYKIATFLFK